MKHHELLMLRNRLQRIDMTSAREDARYASDEANDLVLIYGADSYGLSAINFDTTAATTRLATLERMISDSISDIENTISEQTLDFVLNDNEYWDQHNVRFKSARYNRDYQQLPITEDGKRIIKSRIGQYTDWKYPGLEIGPGDGEWTSSLVACDPLYILDHNDECLTTTKSQFSATYQNRLRCYKNRGEGLHMLPQEQFGFVFSWNTFNYFSFKQISDYLDDIWKVLRPGGACMFSYNNVEEPLSAKRAEDHLMSFIPKTMLCGMLEGYGFEHIKAENTDSTVSWVEFRKPGTLKSNRTGQTLGKIILTPHIEA